MFELLILMAIAYAGARGVESLVGTTDRRHDTGDAGKTVAKMAASGPKSGGAAKNKPGPADPGGTFSSAAPRSAALGGRAAVPFAVITETSSTMWKATLEGYRDRWPEIREEHRRRMVERAAIRKVEKEEAEEAARVAAAAAKASLAPQPPYPPRPAQPPTVGPGPARPVVQGPVNTQKKTTVPTTSPGPNGTPGLPGPGDVPAPQKTTTMPPADPNGTPGLPGPANVPAGVPAQKAPAAFGPNGTPGLPGPSNVPAAQTTPVTATIPAPAHAGRPRLVVVPSPAHTGDLMSSPSTLIPEIRTLDGLLNAMTLTRAMCEMRSEEAEAIAADDLTLSNRLDQIEAEMAAVEVDASTRGEVDALRESIHNQSHAAAQYGAAAKDAADLALATAGAASKSHGGIAEAVQSSPIPVAAQAGYYEH